MKATVYSHKKIIATVELHVGDESMGCVYGNLNLTDSYYEDVQKFAWKFNTVSKPNYGKWHSLRFNVQLENGYFLYPAGGYTIDDIFELPDEPVRIDIAGLDKGVMEDFFLQETPRPFVEEPWEQISVEQKIAFEDELKKKIGLVVDSSFDIFKNSKTKHELADFAFSALCKYGCSDDVLFVARKLGCDKQFATIHLTWSGKKETGDLPIVNFYKDFDEFKYFRMYPDKAEWED